MHRCPRCHNIGLSVTHEVFDEDEESEHGLKEESDQTLANTRQGGCIQQAKVGVYQVSFSPLPLLGFLLSSNHLFRWSGNLQLTIHLS